MIRVIITFNISAQYNLEIDKLALHIKDLPSISEFNLASSQDNQDNQDQLKEFKEDLWNDHQNHSDGQEYDPNLEDDDDNFNNEDGEDERLIDFKFAMADNETNIDVKVKKEQMEDMLEGLNDINNAVIQKEVKKSKKRKKKTKIIDEDDEEEEDDQNDEVKEEKENLQIRSRYRCFICKKMYDSDSEVQDHIQSDHANQTILCNECNKPFRDDNYIRVHYKVCHVKGEVDGNSKITCDICGESFLTLRDLEDHFVHEHQQIQSYHCPKCYYFSYSEKDVHQHVGANHTRNLRCNVCGIKVKNYVRWHVHNEYHKKYAETRCSDCNKTSKSIWGLQTHYRIYHKKKLCDFCLNWIQTDQLKVHHESCKPIKVHCDKCTESFETKDELNTHFKNIHQRKQMYNCDSCPSSFSNPYQMARHKRKEHESNEEQCTHCGKVFDNKGLEQHLHVVHGEIKALKCEYCDEEFVGKFKRSQYEEHVTTYHVTIPESEKISCETCGKTFHCKTKLGVHIKEAHTDSTNERERVQCPHCNKYLFNKYVLQKHIKAVHLQSKNIECELCKKRFVTISQMKRHNDIIHKKLRPYQCHLCERAFAVKCDLKKHIDRVHLKMKYPCNLCGKMLIDLPGHIRDVHKIGKQRKPRAKKPKGEKMESQPMQDIQM